MLQLLICISKDTEESGLLSLWQTWWFVSFITLPCVWGDGGGKNENPHGNGLAGLWAVDSWGLCAPGTDAQLSSCPSHWVLAAGPGDPGRGRRWWIQSDKTAAARSSWQEDFFATDNFLHRNTLRQNGIQRDTEEKKKEKKKASKHLSFLVSHFT